MAIQFKDRSHEEAFTDKAFAFEAECSATDSEVFNGQIGKSIFCRYNARIWEAEGIHLLSSDHKQKIMKLMKDKYEYEFPIGCDGYTSGWNHFHIFYDVESFEALRLVENSQLLEQWQVAVPLYAKYHNWKWYHRHNNRAQSLNEHTLLPVGSKSYSNCLKTSYSSTRSDPEVRSIEYRLNNVLDPRLYGYYLACTIAWVTGIKPDMSNPEYTAQTDRVFYGMTEDFGYYDEDDYDEDEYDEYDTSNWRTSNFDIRDTTRSHLWEVVNQEFVNANMKTLFDILDNFGMVKAKKSLQDYLEEYQIPYSA